ncbi:T9SS type B sorting domain-containing protein [Parapedobacter sp.]
MKRIVPSCCLLCAALFLGDYAVAQLTLRVDAQFFEGREIRKVETTSDGHVWVLGDNNFIARVSPDDGVEDFTALFAAHSTKPFTDISAHHADTLLLGTAGDYAFLFTGGAVQQLGPSMGVHIPNITGVAIPKQFYLTIPGHAATSYTQMVLTAGWETFGRMSDGRFAGGAADLKSTPQTPVTTRWWQNDRKGFVYTHHYAENHAWLPNCYGREISAFELFMPWSINGLQQAFVDQAGDPRSIRAAFYTPRVKLEGLVRPGFFWAGESGLNFSQQTFDCFARSTPIPFFNGKEVSCITDINALAAHPDYLSFLVVGTSAGLFVSSESQKRQVETDYLQSSALGSRRINDMESFSTGSPSEFDGQYGYTDAICEKWLYVGTEDGLFKMDYTIAAASYSHVGQTVYKNGTRVEGTSVTACPGGNDVLYIPLFLDSNNAIQWQLDGENISGADTIMVPLTKPGVYRAVMWSACENIEIYSPEITVEMAEMPEFTFDYPDTVDLCLGNAFLMEVTDGQPDYTYQWYWNGTALTDETNPSFSATMAGTYYVGVRTCGDNIIFSDSVTIRVHQLQKPQSPDTDIHICEGEPGRLRLRGYAPEVTARWYRDGVLIPGESDTVLTITQSGMYAVEVVQGDCSVMSDELSVQFVALPEATITATSEAPLCPGTSTTLTADHADGETYTYRWSTGATTRSITVGQAGEYTLVLTNAAGCADTTSIEVQAYDPLPAPPIRDTVLCSTAGEVVRIEAPEGYAAYRWSGGVGNGRYVTIAAPGTYSLEVWDENGCTATATFDVRAYCEDLIIPNLFSPNGDGVNDEWVIGGLEDGGAVVTVFDRNGQIVFQSRGYATPWDGLYRGGLVPVGAYYYRIITSTGEAFKGALNVLY